MSGNKCANCGKGVMYGHNVSHAKNRTRKIFKPNLHKARILIGANKRTMKLCTKCLRMYREVERDLLAASRKTKVNNDSGDKTSIKVESLTTPSVASA